MKTIICAGSKAMIGRKLAVTIALLSLSGASWAQTYEFKGGFPTS
jgi:hypothetical protein